MLTTRVRFRGRRRRLLFASLPLLALAALSLGSTLARDTRAARDRPDPAVIAANRSVFLNRLDRWERAAVAADGSVTLRRSDIRYIRRIILMDAPAGGTDGDATYFAKRD
jgi:hypothetical protein